MWDFFETVRHRHSVRKYQTARAVEAEKLHAILEIACAAPSAGDLQAYRVVAVTDAAVRRALSHAALDQAFVAEAPVCLVFCAEAERSAARYGERGRALYAVQDATIAAAYAQLAAVAAGMACAWVGSFDDTAVREVLQLDRRYTPIALITVGYAAEIPELTPRRPLPDVVEYR
jgi:nitroreductase